MSVLADEPSSVSMYSVWVYWLGVLLMSFRVRLQGAASAGLVPRQPLERLMWIVWIPVIAAWIVFPWLSIHRSSPPWRLPEPAQTEPAWLALRWVASGITVACLAGTMFCWRWMGRHWRVGVDADQPMELITTGPFSRARHPIYALSMVMMIATLVAVPIWPLLLTAVLHILLMQVKARNEERWMLQMHGEAYVGYRERTGRFLPKV